MSGRLVVCPTPIGNLGDASRRLLDTLAAADVVACEDTRHTGLLLSRLGVRAASLVALHEHNERARSQDLAQRAAEGAVVALCTDAGTPVVSDPGWRLVRACVEAGVRVEALPGPSAVICAVVVSGLPAERWTFVGFLPRKVSDLEAVWRRAETVVAFESPRRVGASLASLAAADPARAVAVCRELTKLHEEVVRGDAASLAARYAEEAVRGEVTLVVAGADGGDAADDAARRRAAEAVEALVEAGARRRAAARVVAGLTGLAANDLYGD